MALALEEKLEHTEPAEWKKMVSTQQSEQLARVLEYLLPKRKNSRFICSNYTTVRMKRVKVAESRILAIKRRVRGMSTK